MAVEGNRVGAGQRHVGPCSYTAERSIEVLRPRDNVGAARLAQHGPDDSAAIGASPNREYPAPKQFPTTLMRKLVYTIDVVWRHLMPF